MELEEAQLLSRVRWISLPPKSAPRRRARPEPERAMRDHEDFWAMRNRTRSGSLQIEEGLFEQRSTYKEQHDKEQEKPARFIFAIEDSGDNRNTTHTFLASKE